MWDYIKLFSEGNVVGLKNVQQNRIFPSPVDGREYWGKEGYVDWRDYYNESLSVFEGEDGSYGFEIVYVVRLDEHGNVIEKLFDRETDMPKPMPELETGMFIKLADRTNWRDNTVAYVDYQNNRIIAKEGWYEKLSNRDEWQYLRIVEVFSKSVCCFNQCVDNRVIWRNPEYQAYLDSKN